MPMCISLTCLWQVRGGWKCYRRRDVEKIPVFCTEISRTFTSVKFKRMTESSNTARFDARLTSEQKQLFKQAAELMGYKSLSEFVVQTTQAAALQIIEKHQQILASEKDKSVFFNAMVKPPLPNKTLRSGLQRYQDKMG